MCVLNEDFIEPRLGLHAVQSLVAYIFLILTLAWVDSDHIPRVVSATTRNLSRADGGAWVRQAWVRGTGVRDMEVGAWGLASSGMYDSGSFSFHNLKEASR